MRKLDKPIAAEHSIRVTPKLSLRRFNVESCPSTQDLALDFFSRELEKASPLDDSFWVALRANKQNSGRGRMGREWADTGAGNFAASFAFKTRLPSIQIPALSLITGLAVWELLNKFCPGAPFFIKWPNDIMFVHRGDDFRKLGGILLELKKQVVLMGIGMNIISIRDNLSHAISLESISPEKSFDLDQWVELLAEKIFHYESNLLESPNGIPFAIQQKLKAAMLPMIGKLGFYYKNPQDPSQCSRAEVLGINFSTGALQVRLLDLNQEISVQSGEFSFSKIAAL